LPTLIILLLAVLFSSCKTSETHPIGQIITPQGEMLFKLHNETPGHKASFIKLANENYWDILTLNRVINNFVIQGDCPDTPEGFSDSPYLLQPDIYGALGAGRYRNAEKLSAGCQLYIVHNKNGLPRLDGDFMIFGQMIKGFEVLEQIASVKTDTLDTPLTCLMLYSILKT
jgi:peptidyl-prolyl cis-trans isomerase B (cyclophilin B)